MIHRHRVPLFAFQSFLCSFDALAHLRASLPLKCKYNAHLRLSTTITTLVVYQAGLCPQVWCCLIHHKGFSLLDSSENYPLMCASCHHPSRLSTSHELAQLKQYFSSICYHQPSWKLPSHSDMHLIACNKKLIVVKSMFFSMDSSQLVKSDHEKKCTGIINDVHHPYSCGEVRIWASKQMAPQSVLVGAAFQHSFKCDYVITSFKSHSYVGDDKPR